MMVGGAEIGGYGARTGKQIVNCRDAGSGSSS